MSFIKNSWKDWAKLFAIDTVFLIAFIILLTFMIIFSALQIKDADSIAEGLMPTMTALQAGNAGSMEKSLEIMDSSLKNIMKKILGSFIINYLVFSIFLSSWAYVSFSRTLKTKMNLKKGIRFAGLSIAWLIAGAVISIFPLIFVFKSLASIIISTLLTIFIAYITIIVFYALIRSKPKTALKDILSIGLKNIHKTGFAFLICLATLLIIDSIFIFSGIGFGLVASLLSILLMVLFISWSRQYLCIEMEGVVGR